MTKVLLSLSAFALLVVLAAAAILYAPLSAPPPLASISHDARTGAATTALAPLQRYRARDGAELAFRAYPVAAPDAPIAILIHGSAGSSRDMNALGTALAARGVAAYALDIRGQGGSGRRGDIDYIGQQEDDVADFAAQLGAAHPTAPLVLIGHSSGGGFALKLAAKPQGRAFARVILLAPYLGYDAPTTAPGASGWSRAAIPRIVLLSILERFHIAAFQDRPVLAFATVRGATDVTSVWSYRMMRGFSASPRFADDARGVRVPLTIIVGARDELMRPEAYAPAFAPLAPQTRVVIVPDATHISLLSDPRAFEPIARAATAAD